MNNSKFSRVSLTLMSVCLLFVCSLFLSCKQPASNTAPSLNGTWRSQYNDGYTITSNHINYDDGGWGYDWEADIAKISSNYIYVKYANGKYYCVAYKNLTDTACSFSNANKAGGRSTCDSLAEAETEFTVENGYFALYSECSKQN